MKSCRERFKKNVGITELNLRSKEDLELKYTEQQKKTSGTVFPYTDLTAGE